MSVTASLGRVQFRAKDGICEGEKKQSVVRQVKEVNTQLGLWKRPKWVWEKAEWSDTEREKMFNLAQCSSETLNLLRLLWKVKAGQRRMCWLTRQERCCKNTAVCVCVRACLNQIKWKHSIWWKTLSSSCLEICWPVNDCSPIITQ